MTESAPNPAPSLDKNTTKPGGLKRLARRRRWTPRVLLFGLLAVLAGSFLYAWLNYQSCPLRLAQGCVNLRYARTEAQREQGLSGTSQLPANQGMLFVFDQDGQPCFWMKDMNYNLDIVWLNQQKQIVKITANAAPADYPDRYCPEQPSRYVLEMTAGAVARNGLTVGQSIPLMLE